MSTRVATDDTLKDLVIAANAIAEKSTRPLHQSGSDFAERRQNPARPQESNICMMRSA